MDITLTWIPAGGPNSTGQNVQFRIKGQSVWTTHNESPLPAAQSSYPITGLLDNQIYELQILNICSFGGPVDSTDTEIIKITCPVLTLTPATTSIAVSFPHLGGSIDKYTIRLYDSNDIIINTIFITTGLSGTISHTFSGLSQSSTYKIKVEPGAGVYEKLNCPIATTSTTAPPSCLAPTNVVATLS